MSLQKFTVIESAVVPVQIENIDTDQIIPARFLKATTREGFGDNLFRDWRYDATNQPVPSFPLNDPRYAGSILVAGKNFGCGSSREHAAWAIAGYGFRAVISSFFADIFRNNALNNGIVPAQVSEAFLEKIFSSVAKDPATKVKVDLIQCEVTLMPTGEKEPFEMNDYKRTCLLNGYDDIDYLLAMKGKIETFESGKNWY